MVPLGRDPNVLYYNDSPLVGGYFLLVSALLRRCRDAKAMVCSFPSKVNGDALRDA